MARDAVSTPADPRETGWNVDDGVGELQYSWGSWLCGWCHTINTPADSECKGYVKGEQCEGSFDRSFARWAPSKPPKPPRATKSEKVAPRLTLELKKEAWWCERCWKGNLCFRVKCYKCSAARPALSDSSDDDEQGPRRNAKTESAAESYLKQQKRERGLRKHRKRGGVKEKARKTKKRRRVVRSGPAAKLAFRGFRAARPKRSKKKARKGWSLTNRARNKRAHALHGNGPGPGLKQFIGWTACLIALPVIRETDAMIDTASSAMQEMIQEGASVAQSLMQEGGHQVRTGIWLVSVGVQTIAVWFVALAVMNFLQRCRNGNTSGGVTIAEMNDDYVIWKVKGSTGEHKVRVNRGGAGTNACACRDYVRRGKCGHIEKALKEHKRLLDSGFGGRVDDSGPPTRGALARGRAALTDQASSLSLRGPDLGGCFQGLVEKAKALKHLPLSASPSSAARAVPPPRSTVVREGLCLDSGQGDPAVGIASSRPDADPPLAIQDVPSSSSGIEIRLLCNQEIQDKAVDILKSVRTGQALMTAYTFDQPDVIESLISFTGPVKLLSDKGQSTGTSTKLQMQSLQQVARSGVKCRMASGTSLLESYTADGRMTTIGKSLKGIQHSKTLLIKGDTESYLLVGSSNWTTSSRSNTEFGFLLQGNPKHEAFQRFEERFYELWNTAWVFDASSQSSEPVRRRRTGKQPETLEES